MIGLRIDASALARYARSLDEARRLFPRAQSALLNNAAFGVRTIALDESIPRVMRVRSPKFLARSLRVDKARTANQTARLYTLAGPRWSGMEEQEFGGTMQRHPATERARGGSRDTVIRQQARLRGDLLSIDDVDVGHVQSERQRVAVFLEILSRRNERRPFALTKAGGIRPGLLQMGKLARRSRRRRKPGDPTAWTRRKLHTLQAFDTKGKTRVRRKRWMKPSVDRWFSRADLQMEYARALRHARLWLDRPKRV